MSNSQLLVALDVDGADAAFRIWNQVSSIAGGAKVGSRLFTLEGPPLIRGLVGSSARVFLDLKFHDIPNTVKQAVEAAAELGVWVCNVHCQGGFDMLKAARDASYEYAIEHN